MTKESKEITYTSNLERIFNEDQCLLNELDFVLDDIMDTIHRFEYENHMDKVRP